MLGANRRAVALLEAMVALTIVALVAVAYTGAGRDAIATSEMVQARERDIVAASALLDAAALWPEADLDRHLGTRRQGPWLMSISRAGTLYRVAISDSASTAPLLATVLYRRSLQRAIVQ